MIASAKAKTVAEYVRSLDLEFPEVGRPAYQHMGAILADAVLQAGLNYNHVVLPRVKNIMTNFPSAITSVGFLNVIETHGAARILSWSHPVKPHRLKVLTEYLVDNGVYTVLAFAGWLGSQSNVLQLLSLPGIGPKTASYVQTLVGLEEVPVDRHVRRFVQSAGVVGGTYEETSRIVKESAVILGIPCSSLDRAIWRYESTRKSVGPTKR